MHWFSILTALTYALILAFLVIIKGWEFQEASDLEESERLKLLERLRLARELIGSVDALDHFLVWKSPDER